MLDPLVRSPLYYQPSSSSGYYYDVTNLKQTKPDLKVLLTVGAGAAISQATWLAVSNDSVVDAFCQSAVLFLRLYNFDGIEITWKTPTTNDIYIKIIQVCGLTVR